MNSVRKVFWLHKIIAVVMAAAIAAFALPAFADSGKKLYNLQMQIVSSPPAPTPPPFTITATLTNEPGGSANFNSFKLAVTGLTIVGVLQPASGQATFTGSTVSVVNVSPVKPGKSFSITMRVSSCGDGAWSAGVWSGTPFSGQTFDLVPAHSARATLISCGNVASGALFTVPDSVNPQCVTGERGYYDKDGVVRDPLQYFVTNTLPSNAQLHFRWPDSVATGNPRATFEYSVCGPGALPEEGLDTQVGWLTDIAGNPAFVDALDCIEPNQLPAPYGTLTAALGTGDTTIPIDTTQPTGPYPTIPYPGDAPVDPQTPGTQFDVVIGTERITVQLVCLDSDSDPTDPGDCTDFADEHEGTALQVVQRGVGGTTAASHSPHDLVMSTPLPILPADTTAPYVAGKQAQMCIADQGNTYASESETITGHFTTFIDIGDGYVHLP